MKFKFKNKPSNTSSEPRKFVINTLPVQEGLINVKNDKYILRTIIMWLIAILASLLIIIFYFSKIPSEIPLFYSRLFGPMQLAKKLYLLLLPTGVFAFGIVNICFALISYKQERFISYVFCLVTLLTTVLGLLPIINIIYLVV